MGVVFLAEDLLLRRRVALKVMKSPLGDSESSRESFLREAQTAASVEHENIVPIYQIGEDRGVLFIAMQLLHGETLEQRLQRDKQLGVAAILRIARDTAQGLAAAHAVGLVHRDIKPANLFLVQPTDRVKILDFGLARQAAGGDVNLSDAGGIVGTLAYMSPEQASGRQVDARSDLFSLGCVLYRLCRGAPPFQRATALALLAALANDDPPAPADNSPGMPRPLSDLVMRLLAKEPQERLASAQELLATLQQMQVFALTNVMGVPGASR
jgi:serine/threonine protein kinase